jgi:ABC-type sugar transport system substrate-binding protein
VNSASIVFGVTQDDALIGRQLAQAICSKNAAAKIVAIPGPAGAEWARLRYVGFMDQVKHCPGTLVFPGAFRGSVDLQEGLTQTADLLQKHPEAEFVYTPQMSLGMGAVQAGRQLGRHVQVVSSAMIGAAVPMLVDGRMLAVVSEPAIIMGRLIVQYAIRDAEQKDKPNFIQPTGAPYPYLLAPATLITSVNAARFPLSVYEIPPSDFQLDAIQ